MIFLPISIFLRVIPIKFETLKPPTWHTHRGDHWFRNWRKTDIANVDICLPFQVSFILEPTESWFVIMRHLLPGLIWFGSLVHGLWFPERWVVSSVVDWFDTRLFRGYCPATLFKSREKFSTYTGNFRKGSGSTPRVINAQKSFFFSVLWWVFTQFFEQCDTIEADMSSSFTFTAFIIIKFAHSNTQC